MKKINENEMRVVNGGGKTYLHCTVCHAAGKDVTYSNTKVGKVLFELHVMTSAHNKNVRKYGYGHACCAKAFM